MPVPRRRRPTTFEQIRNIPSLALKLLDADFLFKKSKTLLFYGITPAVVLFGMMTEPRPAWMELLNILEQTLCKKQAKEGENAYFYELKEVVDGCSMCDVQ